MYEFDDIIPISALKNDNIDRLIDLTKTYLRDDVKYYEDDVVTNTDPKFMIQELVREKILNLTNDEVPHNITTVGKQGSMLKAIGMEARKDIEHLLGKQVYLELYVRTVKNWRNEDKYLHELGFDEL